MDQPTERPAEDRFRHIDARIAVHAIEVSRKLGVLVFLPLALVSALVALITFNSLLVEFSSGGPYAESRWFIVSFLIFVLSLALFSQRKRPRPIVLIPSGIFSITVGLVLLVGWCSGIAAGCWKQDLGLALLGLVLWFGPLAFGWSLCRYGFLFKKEMQANGESG